MTEDSLKKHIWMGPVNLSKKDHRIVRTEDDQGNMKTHIVPKDDDLAVASFTGSLTDVQAYEVLEFAQACETIGKGIGYYDGLAEKIETINKELIRRIKAMSAKELEALIKEAKKKDRAESLNDDTD